MLKTIRAVTEIDILETVIASGNTRLDESMLINTIYAQSSLREIMSEREKKGTFTAIYFAKKYLNISSVLFIT